MFHEMRLNSINSYFSKMSVWQKFQELYPHADLSKFFLTDWDDAVYFKSKNDGLIQVFDKRGSNNYYYTDEIKKAMGHVILHSIITTLSSFPQVLFLNPKPKLPVPALGHADKPQTLGFSNLEIFVTPKDSFKMKFRNIFVDTKLTHHSGKESHRWLNPQGMSYWPQHLTLDEKLNLLKFARVANMMQIQVYTYSKDGKYRICYIPPANTVFTIFAIGVNMVNMYLHHICHPVKFEQIQVSSSVNFAVWCATTGCGISSKMLFDDGLPKQVKSFLWFHI